MAGQLHLPYVLLDGDPDYLIVLEHRLHCTV